MALPQVATHDEWLGARKKLLEREKELVRAQDAVAAERRRLPMVRIAEDYRFTGPDGEVGLLDLFAGHRQLLVQHLMFDPEWDVPCPSCSGMADDLGAATPGRLARRDTSFVAVSRAPWEKLRGVAAARGWTFPWFSSLGSRFNHDFHVTLDPAVVPASYNFLDTAELAADPELAWMVSYVGEQPGISAFLRDGDDVYLTYSTYGRGVEVMMHAYHLLDLTALGRQETWEEPAGRAPVAHDASAGAMP
ncbi:DUF899 domain-containing protein [Actinomycetospora straminea]|uniref:DUF899 domain-containing protein n=1 Tax=Actinomycetospora straminea TaxID=663607 RepID=A0ABP9F254_9PSEU|nr:DUF899 domain-containing protein [Actinomycetospora straminea]MDD7935590.1 DUF899 domain-containing protein [Actinomycetospora straminea]